MASQIDDADYIIELMKIAKTLKELAESLTAFPLCELKMNGIISNYGLEIMNTDLNDSVLISLKKIKKALEVNENLSMISNVALQGVKWFLEKNMELQMIKNNLESKYVRKIESRKSITGTEIYNPCNEVRQANFPSYKNISRQDFNFQGLPLRSHPGGINTYIYKINYQGEKACIKVYSGEKNHASFNDVQIEILILEELDQINSNEYLKYFGKCIVDENNTRQVFIITQWIEKDLLQYIEEVYNSNLTIPEEKLKIMFKKLAETYKNLHERRIFHMDIKPANILIDENDKLYVIDFNVSAKEIDVYTHSRSYVEGHVGTNGYMAPEIQLVADSVLQNEHVYELNFKRSKADVFSLGMTFLHMLNLFKVGLNTIGKENDLKFVLKKVPEWARNLLEAMLDFDKAKRPNMSEVYIKLYDL
jgi:serine/threonine protein kinase